MNYNYNQVKIKAVDVELWHTLSENERTVNETLKDIQDKGGVVDNIFSFQLKNRDIVRFIIVYREIVL